eukprot:gene12997-15288_t
MTLTCAVIGAGVSGLVATKEASVCGMTPTVFEATTGYGGLWNQKTEVSGMWDSMRTNISRHSCVYSDHPWPKNAPTFPGQADVYAYLKSYAEANDLVKYIKFSAKITNASLNEDSRWQLTWTATTDNTIHTEIFDRLIVATGAYSTPYCPTLCPGIETFKGQLIHSRHYRNPKDFSGKRVAVIGGAYSGVEISCDLVGQADHILNTGHRFPWVVPRLLPLPPLTPHDAYLYTRARSAKIRGVPAEQANPAKAAFFKQFSRQQDIQALSNTIPPSELPFIAISDHFVDHVANNRIEFRTDSLVNATANSLVFADGTERQIDTIIYSTGYRINLDFFDDNVKQRLSYDHTNQYMPMLLHKYVFPPAIENLAFVGVFRGSFFTLVELQARWASLVLGGQMPAPSTDAIQAGVAAQSTIRQSPRMQYPYPDYVALADELAAEFGVLPDLELIKSSDPALYSLLWDQVLSPFSYRLIGRHSNPILAKDQLLQIKPQLDSVSINCQAPPRC